jgi:hypothetical protein
LDEFLNLLREWNTCEEEATKGYIADAAREGEAEGKDTGWCLFLSILFVAA